MRFGIQAWNHLWWRCLDIFVHVLQFEQAVSVKVHQLGEKDTHNDPLKAFSCLQLRPSAADWCPGSSSWGPPRKCECCSPLKATVMFFIKNVRDWLLWKETYPHHPIFPFHERNIKKAKTFYSPLQLVTHFTAVSANGFWRGKTISFVPFWNFAALGKTRVQMRLAMEMSNAADQ